MIPNTSTQLLLCNCVLVSLCVCGQGRLFSEADGDGARKKRGGIWDSSMEKFILYVSPNWSLWQFPVSLIHTWQQISLVSFQTLPISAIRCWKPRLENVPICMCHCAWPELCAHIRVMFRVRKGKGALKENESAEKRGALRSHFMSLQAGTLDSRTLAYFSCRQSANLDYYLTVLGKWACLVFLCQSALTGMWRVLQDACCCLWQGGTLSGSDCPSSVQSRRLDFRRHISWCNLSLTIDHTNCFTLSWDFGFPFLPINVYVITHIPSFLQPDRVAYSWHFLWVFSCLALMYSGVQ